MSNFLDSIESPEDLRTLTRGQLRRLSEEVRELIIEVISQNGGHLASNLGVVELTVALHYCFDFLKDALIWDVGHQCYTHKILTGRKESFHTLRQENGISGFANKEESPYDRFSFGHTGTSLSAGLGLACASEITDEDRRIVAVIGDGAIASGMPFEALNHAGDTEKNLLFILNDNEMSISPSVGGVAGYLSKIRSSTPYVGLKKEIQELTSRWQSALKGFNTLYGRLSDGLQSALTPGGLFVELGFHYYGPVDGHNMGELIDALNHMKRIDGPVLLHVLTEKGKGFKPAHEDPTGFHSSGTFRLENGKLCVPEEEHDAADEDKAPSWSEAMGNIILRNAQEDESIVSITAAMCHGTGLRDFSEEFPDRFYDVGICEQHGLGFAGGLAAANLNPVFCIYSTFLQRAFDQLFHDIALQKAHVIFGIDRAGLVGNDGPTHHGLHDIACCRAFPGFVVMAPADQQELEIMFDLALDVEQPCAIRYPREKMPPENFSTEQDFAIGQAEYLAEGEDAAIVGYGAMVSRAVQAAGLLEDRNHSITVVNARFAKPVDRELLVEVVENHKAVLLAEDHSEAAGFGSAVMETLSREGINASNVRIAAVPDQFIPQATREDQLAKVELDPEGLARRVQRMLG
ncbi:MAG: 1-deoxy-D-xylulose-5-phosphate synthase [Planctomycetes bacterium]|nr:1-deoxy-D-xylulose-5-phosphate synthase [Planctomycetota bacterium]